MSAKNSQGAVEPGDHVVHSRHETHLIMHEDVHDVVVDLRGASALGLVGQQHVLDPQEGHQDQGGPHSLHVQAGLCLVGHLQLGDQDAHDVQQEKQIYLRMEGEVTWCEGEVTWCSYQDLEDTFMGLVCSIGSCSIWSCSILLLLVTREMITFEMTSSI